MKIISVLKSESAYGKYLNYYNDYNALAMSVLACCLVAVFTVKALHGTQPLHALTSTIYSAIIIQRLEHSRTFGTTYFQVDTFDRFRLSDFDSVVLAAAAFFRAYSERLESLSK